MKLAPCDWFLLNDWTSYWWVSYTSVALLDRRAAEDDYAMNLLGPTPIVSFDILGTRLSGSADSRFCETRKV